MQALILAGGKGTRLRPFTFAFPKPLLPVGEIPIIETIVRQLSFYGFKDIIISLGYLSDYIKIFFSDKSKIPEGVNINYIKEDKPLGTSGPVGLLGSQMDENILVINGDILSTINYSDMLQYHIDRNAVLTMAVGKKEVKVSLGVVDLDDNNQLLDFREKPTFVFNDNMGVYIYNKKALKYIPKNERLDLNHLALNLINDQQPVYGFRCDECYYWIDVGQHADYDKANEDFKKFREKFLPQDKK